MKFKLIETVQTANGKGFKDGAGNVWQARAFYNLSLKTIVYLPATTAVCKTLTVNAMRYKGKPVIDQANYLLWCKRYNIAPTEKRLSFFSYVSRYLTTAKHSATPATVTARQ